MNTTSRVVLAFTLSILTSAAWSGDYQAGLKAFNAADYDTALAEWQPLADAGDAHAQYGLGRLYGNGFGVDMNDAKAIEYFTLAAEQGLADAQYKLGVMHQNGWGLPMDEKEAARFFTLAAEQAHVEAQMGLAHIYAASYSPLYDTAAAYKWFTIASQLGNLNATVEREEMAREMSADEVIEADGEVNLWMEGHSSLVAIDE